MLSHDDSNMRGLTHVAQNIPYTFTEVKKGVGSNMIISPAGTYLTVDKVQAA